jgi:hypothetical protein
LFFFCYHVLHLAWIFYVLLFLNSCGNVGEPRPPLVQIPAPVSDLQAVQQSSSIKLSFTVPRLNTDGSAATTLSQIEIYRLATNSTQPTELSLESFGQAADKWKSISRDEFDKFRQGDRIVVLDTFPNSSFSQALRFHYAVKAVNRKHQDAGLSNLVSLSLFVVPMPPNLLRSELAEKSITLHWEPPALNNDGSKVTALPHFNVYRSSDDRLAAVVRLNQASVDRNTFKDESIELDKTYYYVVRSLIDTPSGPVESGNSKVLAVINSDTYPPKAPAEVTAVSGGQFISLVWLPNTEPDLAGYRIYRAGADREFRRLNEDLIPTASTIDKTVQKGQTYLYRVQAVDLKGNESEFSEEAGESVE